MAQRDYASRKNVKKKKSKSNVTVLLAIAAVVVIAFAGGLYLLKEKAPEPVKTTEEAPQVADKTQPKTVLPSRLEERWNYIKELETREIPIDDSQSSIDKNAQLSDEQKKILVQMEKDRQEAELAKQKQAEQAKLAEANANKEGSDNTTTSVNTAESKKVTVMEAAKSDVKRTETVKTAERVKETEKLKEAVKEKPKETKKAEPSKDTKTASTGKFGLQCGAFKNKTQADALQAKLTMAGFNARVNSSTDWNRVVIGPVGDRGVAVSAQSNAKSIANCVVIGM
ncbi:cell division protein FtsN [Cricetibacter osteomyelitidis]|uniref:Cell division protein FtsN n=1 Tax=Cricetibacter osteomyelitidis TaxID=1521931 RepID=A0A4R2SLW6_9PAST|nr:cell division protein FtsN [Cricetibacter osteomyelitidis]TCP90160.1 cell division protein FtsN [Cricetibacter osteomyelitidis]